jgi:predicted permease
LDGTFSTLEYQTYREQTQTLSVLAGHSEPWETTLGGESPQQIGGTIVTCSYFDVLGQRPALGRGLTEADCIPGADPVVVLGHELWTNAFDADPTVLGRSVELNRQLFNVVGVAAESTYGGFFYATAFFAPISAQPLLTPERNRFADDNAGWLVMLGRRADGVGIDLVRAEFGVIAAQIDALTPGRATTLSIERSTPLSYPMFRNLVLGIGAVAMAAFGLVLMIACANVANLLLARATSRSREIAVRMSIGATRARVIRQLLTESALIAFAGGALGLVLAVWSSNFFVAVAVPSVAPVGIPEIVLDPSPDIRVLILAFTLALATGLLFGLAPALHASKPDLHTATKQDTSGTSGRRGGRLQGTLVGVQVALCMVLVIGAGLLVRGMYAAQTADPGFAYRDVVFAAYDLQGLGYDAAGAATLRERMLARAAALPGVEGAAYALLEPLASGRTPAAIRLPGQDPNDWRVTPRNHVTPDYFSVVGIPVVQGRSFTDAELADDSRAAIVTEATARNYWPGQDPIGQTLLFSLGASGGELELQIVGVAKDAQVTNLGQIDPYYLYLPATPQMAAARFELLVKTRAGFETTAASIRAAARELDASLAIRVSPLEANLEWAQGLSGIATTLAVSLGALALALATVGIYAVVSYAATRRTREIGIRIALGARSRDVIGLIFKRTMRPVAIGAVIGIAAAAGVSRILSSVLYGVSPFDPIAIGGAAVCVIGIALAAGFVPGRRAAKARPMTALHYE